MSAERLQDPNYFDSISKVLHDAVEQDLMGEIAGVNPPEGWKIIQKWNENFEPFKAILINPDLGIFAKVYAERTKNYAEAVYECLKELATIDMETPVLAPSGYSDQIIFFPLGTPLFTASLANLLKDPEHEALTAVIDKHFLETLGWRGKVDVVRVGEKNYIADPLDDSVASISDFFDRD